jgi:hypothetical protein
MLMLPIERRLIDAIERMLMGVIERMLMDDIERMLMNVTERALVDIIERVMVVMRHPRRKKMPMARRSIRNPMNGDKSPEEPKYHRLYVSHRQLHQTSGR